MTLPTCSNPVRHTPRVHLTENHHHPPTAWRRLLTDADQGWWRIVGLCSNCHSGQYHQWLDHHTRAVAEAQKRGDPNPQEALPSAALARTYSAFIRSLVAEAWAHRPAGRPPYTLKETA